MTHNPFGHVDLRVCNLDAALALYGKLLPALGYTGESSGVGWTVFAAGGEFPARAFFGLIEDAAHRPNANRIAFWVATTGEVDRIGALLRELDAKLESGPRACPEYSPSYYGVFFQDPSGNALEVYFRAD